MPSGRRWSVAAQKPVHQTTASTALAVPSLQITPVLGEAHEGADRLQHAPIPRFLHRRDHHDVAEGCGRGFAEVAPDPGARPLEEDASVDIVGQEDRIIERSPGGVGDQAQLGEDLGAGIAAAHDEHAHAREGLGAPVVGGMELGAAESCAAGIAGDDRSAPGAVALTTARAVRVSPSAKRRRRWAWLQAGWFNLAPCTGTDHPKGVVDVRARYGSAPLGVVNRVALKGNVLDWIEMRWVGKGADRRLDPFKFALSWATGRHPERVPVTYLHGIPRFYEGADRAEIIWEDAEVDLFCQRAPELHADAVRLARETGLRIGDLVELERSEIKKAADGSRAIILRRNKRRRRIVNMPLTPAAEAIIVKAPLSRRLILKPMRAAAWDSARLSREVREYATEFEIRPELRFNDLRGTKVTEMVWSGISVPDLAIRIGWKIETAAKMLGVYAALNPGRAMVVTLPGLAKRDDVTS